LALIHFTQFSRSLVGSLEKKVEQTTERVEARQMESIVRQRVAEELEKIKSTESKLKESFYIELKQQNEEKDNLDSNVVGTDIETMISRISR
jgi:altered-inheritance-of-mitochondria protein 13